MLKGENCVLTCSLEYAYGENDPVQLYSEVWSADSYYHSTLAESGEIFQPWSNSTFPFWYFFRREWREINAQYRLSNQTQSHRGVFLNKAPLRPTSCPVLRSSPKPSSRICFITIILGKGECVSSTCWIKMASSAWWLVL